MLHYQSALLQSLATVFYSLPMLLGFAEEKQIVRINLFEEYVEDSVSVGTCTHLSYSLNANKYDMLKTLKCNKKSCFLSFVEGDL